MRKMTGESKDIEKANLAAMQQLFPEAFEEGKIDFDILRQLLGDYVDDEEERYSFRWNGKSKALRLSQTPSIGTLRPCKEESKNWDTTANLYIEGDNLEVLKLLQKSYYGKVKMIYIDPPYNTGGDFVYKDDFRDNIENYKRVTGQVDGAGHRIDTNTESNGRFHTDWLNMMYPRLRLARNLLSDDGVIFISIDENEQENLKRICGEIFGETNFVCTFKWNRVAKAPSLSGMVRTKYEYIISYYKAVKPHLFGKESYNTQGPLWHLPNKRTELFFPANSIRIPNSFEAKEYGGSYQVEVMDDMLFDNGLNKNAVRIRACSAWGQAKINDYIQKGNTFQIKKTPATIYIDLDNGDKFIAPSDLITYEECGVKRNTDADDDMKRMGIPFDYSKPVSLPQYLIKSTTYSSKNAIVLDFFSGSATTAHAAMQLNAEDGGKRKFIMVQLPEPTAEGSEAAKAGYHNICEIGKERIRRAGEKIKAAATDKEKVRDLDIGFKVFKLDSSNFAKWNPQPKDLQLALQESIENFLPGRTELDVVYEILLKMGLDLSMPIEEREAAGEKVYIVGVGALMICLGEHITLPVIEEMAKLHKEYDSELWQVVFRDNGFASDMDKTNSKETLKAAGLDEDSFISV